MTSVEDVRKELTQLVVDENKVCFQKINNFRI